MSENNNPLTIKIVGEGPYSINTSSIKRNWMDMTQSSHAYRCLPMTSANSHGWTINLEKECVVEWDGTENQKSVKVLYGPGEENVMGGFVTFKIPYKIRTSSEYYLWCSGQPNYIRDDIIPLNAIIRTDWYPSNFQFTWRLIKPGRIVFEKGMPIMFFMPYPKNVINNIEISLYNEEPSIKEKFNSSEYSKYLKRSDKKVRNGEKPWKDWVGLYKTGQFSEKSKKISEDASWIPKPQKPKKKD